MLTKSNIC